MNRPVTRYSLWIGNQVNPLNPRASGPSGSHTRSERRSPLTCTAILTVPVTSSSAPGLPSSFSTTGDVTRAPLRSTGAPGAGSKRTVAPCTTKRPSVAGADGGSTMSWLLPLPAVCAPSWRKCSPAIVTQSRR